MNTRPPARAALILLALAFLFAAADFACAQTGFGVVAWNSGPGANGRRYEAFLVPGGISWRDAEANAVALGGHLASIHSPEENDFVFSLVSNPRFWQYAWNYWRGPWIGGVKQNGIWAWSDGTPFNYNDWYPGQPDNYDGVENNIELYGDTIAGTWNDEQGDDQYPPTNTPAPQNIAYVVEWPASVPVPVSGLGYTPSFIGISADNGAHIRLYVGAGGKFTGVLNYVDGRLIRISGKLTPSGYFVGASGTVPYSIQVTGSTPSTYQLAASVAGYQIQGFPPAYNNGETAAEKGRYSLLFSGTDTSASVPQGVGYATVIVNKDGSAVVVGRLADGATFSAASFIVKGASGHQLIIFDKLYKTNGLFAGILNFDKVAAANNSGLQPNLAANTTLSGTFAWLKPPSEGTYYSAGFGTTLEAEGAFLSPGKLAHMPFTSGTVTVAVPESPINQPFERILYDGTLLMRSPNPANVHLSINRNTGAVSGSFQSSAGPVKLEGMILEDGTNSYAAGFYLSPVTSGTGVSMGFTFP